jgi:tRNA(adenine34) deaminase
MAEKKKWVRDVKTVSTFPPKDLFTKDAETIARVMATKKVSPKGIGSGIRMIQFFINRAGKSLPAARKQELEKAKRLLQTRTRQHKGRRQAGSRADRRAGTPIAPRRGRKPSRQHRV